MFHYTKAVLRVIPRIVVTYLFKLKKYGKNPSKYDRIKRFATMRKLSQKILLALGADITVFGLENLPMDTNFCMVANHMSMIDPLPFMVNYDKPLTFVGKKELMDMPMVPNAFRSIEGEYIDRDDLRQSLKVMLRVEEDLKKGEKSWMIFPEGTRIRDQLLPVQAFHHGTFRPGTKAGVPIVPAAIYGTFRLLKSKPQFKKYPVFISILKPITPEEYAHKPTCDIALMCQQAIQREITYHLRPLDHRVMSESKDKNYIFTQVL